MKTLQLVAIPVALSLWSTCVVLAADPTTEAIADSIRFNGFYVRGQTGNDPVSTKIHPTKDDSNLFGGAPFGYRHQTSNYWVFSIEASIGDQTGATRSRHHVCEPGQIWGLAASIRICFGQYKYVSIDARIGIGDIKVATTADEVAAHVRHHGKILVSQGQHEY